MKNNPDLLIRKIDETYIHIKANNGIRQEISDEFCFEVPNAKFMKTKYARRWDGKIRLFNRKYNRIYLGLLSRILEFAKRNNYSVDNQVHFPKNNIDIDEFHQFIFDLNLPFVLEEQQYKGILQAITYNRKVILSPTGSGKSLMVYVIAKWFGLKTLIVVPTTNLVHQSKSDLLSYGAKPEEIHCIYAGQPKVSRKPIVISTWQSIYNQKDEVFKDYEVIIGDEAHGFKAKSLVALMEKMNHVSKRIGMTGTLDETEVNELVITGLFGDVYQAGTTDELMQKKSLAQLDIEMIHLCHDLKEQEYDYRKYIDWLVSCEKRNEFISKLAVEQEESVLVLYQFVEKHGQILYDMISKLAAKQKRKIYFVHGNIKNDNREYVRNSMEKESNSIVVASFGVFSTGINIPSLRKIIFASSTKSKIRVLQSIGRGLRKKKNDGNCVLYDIGDDTFFGKRHSKERKEIYNSENFSYREYYIPLKK